MDVVAVVKDALEVMVKTIPGAFINIQLSRKTLQPHVPGQAAAYDIVTVIFLGFVTDYSLYERQSTLIQANDVKIYLLPEVSSTIPQPNDELLVGAMTYRAVNIQQTLIGSEIMLFEVQARPG